MWRIGASKMAAVWAAILASQLFIGTVSCAPADLPATSGVSALLASKGSNGRSQDSIGDDKLDKDVQELERLKPVEAAPWGSSMTMIKTESKVVKNVNGQKEVQSERQEEVDKNGKLIARVHQQREEKADISAPTPLTHIRTEVEIPQKNIHKVYEQGRRINEKRKSQYLRPDADENNVDMLRSYSGVQFSPMDMAEYIFWAGDEKGVTMAIEDFLDEGLMSREEAISYLQDIKMNLDYLQSHYTEQMQKESLAREQTHQFRKNLGLLDKAKQARNEASELMEVRQQMRENVNKKNAEALDSDSMLQSKQRLLQAQGLADDDYDDLLERLRVADFLYTEYSLEEVIYQLAKVMFSQSLTRGSSEAQEALEKFTRFLETEAEMGRISRSLEKKVLDVLIAGLTDTLTEHPELVAVARESLGVGAGSPVDDQVLQQLLILNRGATDKTDMVKAHSGLVTNSNSNGNRFLLKELNSSPEGAPVMMKKSAPPAKAIGKLSANKST